MRISVKNQSLWQAYILILLISSSLSFSTAAANNPATTQQVENELKDLGDIYRVVAPNSDLLSKAAITFHGNLLETNSDKLIHVMSLNAEEVSELLNFGFKIQAANNWKDNYRLERAQQIESINQNNTLDSQNDVTIQSIPNYACYPTVEETFSQAASLANQYPTLATWNDIGDSWEKLNTQNGYDLMVLKVSNQAVTGNKPILFIHSAMHAREYTTAALTLEFATQMLNAYGTDADYTWIVDHHEVHFLFHMNPDGRKKAETGILWRKNTNQNYCGATSNSRGADLNRNFTHKWNATNGSGSSGNQCASTYRGPAPASEPETQAVENYVRSLFPDQRGPSDSDAAPSDLQGMHLDIHSYSELILWPWGHTSTPAPNATALQTLGRKLAYWNGYKPEQSVGLYPTDGTSDDVSYGELGVPHYTYELGTAFFQACSTYENTIKPDNLPSLKYAAKVIRAPYLLPSGPEIVSVLLNGESNTSILVGTNVSLEINANDARYENGNGTEPSQNISEAEYYLNTPPWEPSAIAIAMNAGDGNFNTNNENANAVIDTSGLRLGKHIVYTRAKDANGQWGAVSAGFITILDDLPPPNNPPAAPTNLSADVVKVGKGKRATIVSIDLQWLDQANNEDGFIIERCLEQGKGKRKTCVFSEIDRINANDVTNYSDTSFPDGSLQYRVKAFNQAGESGSSNVVSAD